MSKDSSAKYYQVAKKDYKKKLVKNIKVFIKKKKKKGDTMVLNNTKIYQKMKSKSWLSIEKSPDYNYKKLSLFEKIYFSDEWVFLLGLDLVIGLGEIHG